MSKFLSLLLLITVVGLGLGVVLDRIAADTERVRSEAAREAALAREADARATAVVENAQSQATAVVASAHAQATAEVVQAKAVATAEVDRGKAERDRARGERAEREANANVKNALASMLWLVFAIGVLVVFAIWISALIPVARVLRNRGVFVRGRKIAETIAESRGWQWPVLLLILVVGTMSITGTATAQGRRCIALPNNFDNVRLRGHTVEVINWEGDRIEWRHPTSGDSGVIIDHDPYDAPCELIVPLTPLERPRPVAAQPTTAVVVDQSMLSEKEVLPVPSATPFCAWTIVYGELSPRVVRVTELREMAAGGYLPRWESLDGADWGWLPLNHPFTEEVLAPCKEQTLPAALQAPTADAREASLEAEDTAPPASAANAEPAGPNLWAYGFLFVGLAVLAGTGLVVRRWATSLAADLEEETTPQPATQPQLEIVEPSEAEPDAEASEPELVVISDEDAQRIFAEMLERARQAGDAWTREAFWQACDETGIPDGRELRDSLWEALEVALAQPEEPTSGESLRVTPDVQEADERLRTLQPVLESAAKQGHKVTPQQITNVLKIEEDEAENLIPELVELGVLAEDGTVTDEYARSLGVQPQIPLPVKMTREQAQRALEK